MGGPDTSARRSERPIPDSYWVVPGRLLAGEYPGAKSEAKARRKLGWLLDAGVTFFLDLTEAGEYSLKPYAALVAQEAATTGRAVVHRRMSIGDMDTPTPAAMTRILDAMEAALGDGHTLYVHCFGGIGRTGTVVGCYLVRHGLTGQQALDRISELRQGTPDGCRRSPETGEQQRMVLDWPVGAQGR